MKTAMAVARVAKTAVRPALWLCACNLLTAALSAQCTSVSQVPNGTISAGTPCYSNNDTLTATGVTINGSAKVTFVAGKTIRLTPGFRATAPTGGAPSTTFHAWVETAPSVSSVSPASGSAMTQTFTFTASSPSGFADISELQLLFNTTQSGADGCYIRYHANALYLADNSGTNWLGGFALGSAGTASNSYCSISGSGASVSGSGTQMSVTVPVTFQSVFAGAKNTYAITYDDDAMNSGWQPMGTWTVPGTPVGPDFSLATPQDTYNVISGVNVNLLYTINVTPVNGFASSISVSADWPMNGCSNPVFTPAVISGPPWRTTVSMSCYEPPYWNGYWTRVRASGGGKSHELSLYLNVTPQQQYYLSTTVNPPGAGSIFLNPTGGWYNSGTSVQITATPTAGYQFTGFSGSITGGSPGYVFMNSNKSVTANFAFVAVTPSITGISPTAGAVGTPVTITGTGFGTSGTVSFGGTAAQQIDSWSPTAVVARVPAGATTGVIALSTGAYQTSYQQQLFQVTQTTVTVTPASATLSQGQSQQFTAAIAGVTNQQVTWSVSPTGAWTINSTTGLFTAPTTVTTQQIVTITATSVAQQTATGTATVKMVPASPTIVSLSLPTGPPQVGFTITGANFGATQGTVVLSGLPGGDRQLTVVSWNANGSSMTVQVPSTTPLGSGQVTVRTSAGTPSNHAPFTVTSPFGCNF